MSLTRIPACTVAFCPAKSDPDYHQCWCGAKEIEHHHVESRGMGGSKQKRNIVALCHKHHEVVTLHDCYDIVTDFDWGKTYTYKDTNGDVLHERTLEAGSAAATEDGAEGCGAQAGAKDGGLKGATFESSVLPVSTKASDNVAAAPSASGKSSAGEASEVAGEQPNATLISASPAEPFSLNKWQEEGQKLAEMGHALKDATSMWQFAVGDWFVRGESALGEEVYGHIDWVGFSGSALRQYSWVAAKVAPDTRVLALSWTHCRAVAALPPAEQGGWLQKAKDEHLTTGDLHRAIHGEKPKPEYGCPHCDFQGTLDLYRRVT